MQLFTLVTAALMSLAAAKSAAKSGPTSIAYVEVNTDAITNVGQYSLDDGSNAFDLAIIFAANINFDGSKAVLYNNDNVQNVLNDAANQIKPLQAKGIKVVLSILGNHQQAGISNFQSEDAAKDFAGQLNDAVQQYGLDGVDFDDEYVNYGSDGVPATNGQSVSWLISALRDEMPDKLITFYNYGPASEQLSSLDSSVGAKISYAWNGNYGSYQPPNIPGLDKSKVSAAAVDFGQQTADQAASLAQSTKNDGYGVFMTYALSNGDKSSYVSGITQALYGQGTKYSG